MTEIEQWLDRLGLGQYAEKFAENAIDFEVLSDLTERDLEFIGVLLGHRKKMLKAIGLPDSETPPSADAERRQLTVMFCDLVGSTALSERLDPEDLREVIRAYQRACAAAIGHFEGYLAKYLGDGLLAYFGYPQAHEDDAARAVRAGLAILDAIARLNRRLEAEMSVSLAVRMGIHTGLVVAGEMAGGTVREERAIVGETPNVAAGLESLAPADGILLGPLTHQLVRNQFECRDFGAHVVKGISNPISVYRVTGERLAESRFAAAHRTGLSALVGRQDEIGLLVDRWDRAKTGQGQVVVLSGEAGVGKSRIVQALYQRVAPDRHVAERYQCSAHHTESALHPVIEQFERSAGFYRDDTVDQKLDKMAAALSACGVSVDRVAPLFADLLSLAAAEHQAGPDLAPERRKQLTLEALVGRLAAVAGRDPVLFTFEDAHWVDPTTLELLDMVVGEIADLPVLVVITCRPEFTRSWDGRTEVTTLEIDRLSREQAERLVRQVAGDKALPPAVLEQIIAKTDGVPLFVEELTKTVLESGQLQAHGETFVLTEPLPALEIPATLRDSLMARLDRLGPVKEVAQIGATFGRGFHFEMVAAISSLGQADLEAALARLIEAGLIDGRGIPPAARYEFRHALMQDAAYQSLLRRRRQELHGRIARLLEDRYRDVVETEPELVARHYDAAEDAEPAARYWLMAGRRAVRRGANKEAIGQLRRGLEVLGKLPETPDRLERELDLHTTLGPALLATEGWAAPGPTAVYRRARELCREVGDARQMFAALWGIWLYHTAAGDVPSALELIDELFDLADREQDADLRMQAHHAAWGTITWSGAFETAFDHVEKGLALYDRDRHGGDATLYGGHDPWVCGKSLGATTLWCLGYPARALESSEAALALADDLGHPPSMAHGLAWACQVLQLRGDVDALALRADALIEISKQQPLGLHAYFGTMYRGWAKAAEGDTEAGLAALGDGLAEMRASGLGLLVGYFKSLVGQVYREAGELDRAAREYDEALALVRKNGELLWEAELLRLKGELLAMVPGARDTLAEAAFREAIAVARRQGSRSFELRAATNLALFRRDRGRAREARDLLAPVYGWFTEGFDTADLEDAKALLERLA